jgi:Protein of unknown function (DUF3142)
MKTFAIAALVACLLLMNACSRKPNTSETPLGRVEATRNQAAWPRVVLWAWERPEDLRFIDPRRVGVSYLVKTIHIERNGITEHPNLKGLRVPAGTWIMACARIEGTGNFASADSSKEVDQVVSQLEPLAKFPDAKAVQIDFDATTSQRSFYRALLERLRQRLPRNIPLSITALASWCEGDDWISPLPVDEAVPMLFRMGPDGPSILFRLQSRGDLKEPLCRMSVGISTDEYAPHLATGRRLYIFDVNGWTKAAFERTMANAKQ